MAVREMGKQGHRKYLKNRRDRGDRGEGGGREREEKGWREEETRGVEKIEQKMRKAGFLGMMAGLCHKEGCVSSNQKMKETQRSEREWLTLRRPNTSHDLDLEC